MKKTTRKKLIRRILIGFGCVCFFFALLFCELIMLSDATFRDFFTSERVSVLKDRPANITKDIVVDACVVKDSGGIKMLIENLIDGIGEKRPNWYFIILASKDSFKPFNFKNKNVKIVFVNYSISKQLVFIRDIMNFFSFGIFRDQLTQMLFYDTIFFNKQSCNLFFDSYADHVINDFSSVPKISLVHDICYFDLGREASDKISFCKKIVEHHFADLRSYNVDKITKFSKKIITVSDFSKERIKKIYNVNDDFVKAIHIKLANRVARKNSDQFKMVVLNKFSLETKKYLVYPSVIRPNKNHEGLLKAFIAYKNNHPSSDIKLLIVGMRDPKKMETFNQLIRDNCKTQNQYRRMKEKIVFTGYVSNKELGVLLSDALAMIFPSLYEGFGMPIVEAMGAGIPIICSDKASLPEVAGNAALFFDPYNIDEIASAIHMISTDEKLRETLIRRGQERLKYFSDRDSMIDEYIEEFEKYMSPD